MSEPELPENLPEELLGELPEELRAFESELRRFTPTPPTLDIAELMFRAGQAAGQPAGQAAGQAAGNAVGQAIDSATSQAAASVATNRDGHASAAFAPSGPSEERLQLPNRGSSLMMMSRPVSGWWRVATALSLSLAAVLAVTLGIMASRQPGVAQREPVPAAPSPQAGLVVAAAPQLPPQPAPRSPDYPRFDRSAEPAMKARRPERPLLDTRRPLMVRDVLAMLDGSDATQDGQRDRDAANESATSRSATSPSNASPSNALRSNAMPSNAFSRGMKNPTRQELIRLYLREAERKSP
jgi:hypothetical protein